MRHRRSGGVGCIWERVRVMCIAVTLSGVLTLAGCALPGSGPRHLDWLYTVPRSYMGFVAIRYMCPGGPPVRIVRDVANVTFAPDGVACAGDSFTPSAGIIAAQDYAGQFIPVRNVVASLRPPGDERGYALFAGPSGQRNGYTYTVAWVGETQSYDTYRATDAFDRDLNTFLATHADSRRATPGPIP